MPDKVFFVWHKHKNDKGVNIMKVLKNIKSEHGAVEIIEAALVFPIVIFVVIILIFYGNMLYQQSKMDAIAVRGAEYLAVMYTNPILREDEIPKNSTEVDARPYRYILGDEKAEAEAKKYVMKLLEATGTGFFKDMEMNGRIKTCRIKNYVVYQTACVEIEYTIKLLPIKLLDGVEVFKCSNATVTAATDPAEFIRNVDMILDYSEEFGLTDKIRSMVDAFKEN